MILLVHSETNARTLARNLGRSEYSYHFVLRLFRPLLERLGTVVEVEDPDTEIDPIWASARDRGEDAVFLCFQPPHKLPVGLRCPTIPVFAWEFDGIPDESWFGDERNDWVSVLRRNGGRAIVHSSHTAGIVRRALGPSADIACIPAPVWSRYDAIRSEPVRPPDGRSTPLTLDTPSLDSWSLELGGYDRFAPEPERFARTRGILERQAPVRDTVLSGVVYTSVLNPFDRRKLCSDMIANFVWAFRDRPDATLLLKITQSELAHVMSDLIGEIVRNLPFRCRVLMIQGLLPQESYDAIVRATTYVVNCSTGEGQCLPLMEFMSCGRPAIAPTHSAMADYVDADNAFRVDGAALPAIWPHDERVMLRTMGRRIDTRSLIAAYRASFVVARTDPARYAAMSDHAIRSLEAHCADRVILGRLRTALRLGPAEETRDPVAPRRRSA